MKHLVVIQDRIDAAAPADPAAVNRAVREWVLARLADETFDCAYYVLPRGGMCIVNAASHEALLALFRSWPSFLSTEFQVSMLGDVKHGIDNNFERILTSTRND